MVERVSDFKMPEKVVTKLLKDSLPDNVVVSKDAKNAVCRSASIFILQLSIAAAEKAQESKRRTLENQDIIKAVTDLGLGEYAPQLVRFGAQRKRNAKRKESNQQKRRKPTNQAGDEPESQLNPDETSFEPSMDEEAEHDNTMMNGDESQNGDDHGSGGEDEGEEENGDGVNGVDHDNEDEHFVDAEQTALGSDSHQGEE